MFISIIYIYFKIYHFSSKHRFWQSVAMATALEVKPTTSQMANKQILKVQGMRLLKIILKKSAQRGGDFRYLAHGLKRCRPISPTTPINYGLNVCST